MLTAPKGRTALLDAIYLGLSQMRVHTTPNVPCSSCPMEVINHSRYNESDIKRLVKEADTQLYAIGSLTRLVIATVPGGMSVRRCSAKYRNDRRPRVRRGEAG